MASFGLRKGLALLFLGLLLVAAFATDGADAVGRKGKKNSENVGVQEAEDSSSSSSDDNVANSSSNRVRRGSGSSNLGVILGAVGVLIALLGAGGAGWWYMTRSKAEEVKEEELVDKLTEMLKSRTTSKTFQITETTYTFTVDVDYKEAPAKDFDDSTPEEKKKSAEAVRELVRTTESANPDKDAEGKAEVPYGKTTVEVKVAVTRAPKEENKDAQPSGSGEKTEKTGEEGGAENKSDTTEGSKENKTETKTENKTEDKTENNN